MGKKNYIKGILKNFKEATGDKIKYKDFVSMVGKAANNETTRAPAYYEYYWGNNDSRNGNVFFIVNAFGPYRWNLKQADEMVNGPHDFNANPPKELIHMGAEMLGELITNSKAYDYNSNFMDSKERIKRTLENMASESPLFIEDFFICENYGLSDSLAEDYHLHFNCYDSINDFICNCVEMVSKFYQNLATEILKVM